MKNETVKDYAKKEAKPIIKFFLNIGIWLIVIIIFPIHKIYEHIKTTWIIKKGK